MAGNLITDATVMLDGELVENVKNVELVEQELAEAVQGLNDFVGFIPKSPIFGFIVRIFLTDDVTEPTWGKYNGKLGTVQLINGKRYNFSGLRLKREGNMTIERDTEQVKEVEFMAVKRTES